jgi:hypothetical protein
MQNWENTNCFLLKNEQYVAITVNKAKVQPENSFSDIFIQVTYVKTQADFLK